MPAEREEPILDGDDVVHLEREVREPALIAKLRGFSMHCRLLPTHELEPETILGEVLRSHPHRWFHLGDRGDLVTRLEARTRLEAKPLGVEAEGCREVRDGDRDV
jgi:hypothetical protein